jgi:hypothetical protein
MANYAVSNSTISGGGGTAQAVGTTYKTLITLVSSTSAPRRGRVYDVLIGTNGTPADNYMEFDIARTTGGDTATTYVAPALDPADATAGTVARVNATAEGTITANSDLFYVGINQRASYRWVAAPGSELVWPATSSNGVVLRVRSGGYTGTATGNVLFQE